MDIRFTGMGAGSPSRIKINIGFEVRLVRKEKGKTDTSEYGRCQNRKWVEDSEMQEIIIHNTDDCRRNQNTVEVAVWYVFDYKADQKYSEQDSCQIDLPEQSEITK